MITLLEDIVAYIRHLEICHHLNCSFDYSFLPGDIIFGYLTPVFHNNAYCALLKRGNLAKCNCAKKALIRCNRQDIYYAKCYAGVEEYVFPVVCRNRTVTSLSVSGYRGKIAAPPDFTKFEERGYGGAEELRRTYLTLRTDVPSLSEILPMIKPLVYMVKQLYLLSEENRNAPAATHSSPPLYHRILDYLINNYTNDISIADIQKYCNYSATLIRRTFRQYSGCSVKSYLIRLRMERAKTLLRTTDMRIRQIADALGYQDANYFILQFKKYCHLSPSKFRQSACDGEENTQP